MVREAVQIDRAYRSTECRTAVRSDYLAKAETGLRLQKDGFTLVFDREPQLMFDKEGNPCGVDAWLRLYDEKGIEIPIDPHRVIINPPLHPRSDVTVTETLARDGTVTRERKIAPVSEQGKREAFYEALWDSVLSQPHGERWEDVWRTGRGTVTTVFATAPGFSSTVFSRSATYSEARAGNNLDVTEDHSVGQWFNLFDDEEFYCYETFIIFDTSGIPDDDEVTGVVLSLYGSSDPSGTPDPDFDLVIAEDDYDGGEVTTSDWVAGANLSSKTTYASRSTSGLNTSGYNAFTSAGAAFNAAINKTGNTSMILYSSRHAAGDQPTFLDRVRFHSADSSGTTEDPKLDITHESTGSIGAVYHHHARSWRKM